MVPSVVGATKMAPNDLCLLEFKLCVISSFPEWVGQNFFFFLTSWHGKMMDLGNKKTGFYCFSFLFSPLCTFLWRRKYVL